MSGVAPGVDDMSDGSVVEEAFPRELLEELRLPVGGGREEGGGGGGGGGGGLETLPIPPSFIGIFSGSPAPQGFFFPESPFRLDDTTLRLITTIVTHDRTTQTRIPLPMMTPRMTSGPSVIDQKPESRSAGLPVFPSPPPPETHTLYVTSDLPAALTATHL